MNVYKAKTLMEGYKIRPNLAGKILVAVPYKELMYGEIYVSYGAKTMKIPGGTVPLCSETFKDKFGRGTYTMEYFEWKPEPLTFGG